MYRETKELIADQEAQAEADKKALEELTIQQAKQAEIERSSWNYGWKNCRVQSSDYRCWIRGIGISEGDLAAQKASINKAGSTEGKGREAEAKAAAEAAAAQEAAGKQSSSPG